MRRFVWLVAIASLIAACGALSGTPAAPASSPSTAESPSGSPSPQPPPSPRPTLTPVPVVCPTSSPLTVHEFQTADRDCYDGRDATIRGWLGDPPAIGWEPPVVAGFPYRGADLPGDGASGAVLWSGPGGSEQCTGDGCASMFLYVASEPPLALGAGYRWVEVTGHVGDPAAEQCYWEYGVPSPEATLPIEDARADCRTRFVLTAIRDDPNPPTP